MVARVFGLQLAGRFCGKNRRDSGLIQFAFNLTVFVFSRCGRWRRRRREASERAGQAVRSYRLPRLPRCGNPKLQNFLYTQAKRMHVFPDLRRPDSAAAAAAPNAPPAVELMIRRIESTNAKQASRRRRHPTKANVRRRTSSGSDYACGGQPRARERARKSIAGERSLAGAAGSAGWY